MAGDWIKVEVSTPDKREVLAITSAMGWDDPDYTVGKLIRVWRWFDQHSVDGNAAGVTRHGATSLPISVETAGIGSFGAQVFPDLSEGFPHASLRVFPILAP